MIPSNRVKAFDRAEEVLNNETYDFSAKYMAVCDLHALTKENPGTVPYKTISALKGLFYNSSISNQTQSYFLYREAAKSLCFMVVNPKNSVLSKEAYATFLRILRTQKGHAQRAASEALGSLPFLIHGPEMGEETIEGAPVVKWRDILKKTGITLSHGPNIIGRSLVWTTHRNKALLVLKLTPNGNSPQSLLREASWVEHLSSPKYAFPVRFNIPIGIKLQKNYLLKLEEIPTRLPESLKLHPDHYAICLITHGDYFTYPNEYRFSKRLNTDRFKEVMFRNAYLFGYLTSLGIIHAAPIPLFHNRIQRFRRSDSGVYEWQRAGRLDQWLHSCNYPNFGLTGVRDFEHLVSFKGSSKHLYPHIGTHLLSLFLVTGSYFRNKEKSRVGFDGQGKPVDARELFDRDHLVELIDGIFVSYYKGFVGQEFRGVLPVDLYELTDRMIDEMGVDRHMEEILRVADQKEMTAEEFMALIQNKSHLIGEMNDLRKGFQDIVIHTGPHLGEFNQRISLPEIVESVGVMAALCILGRYCEERSLGLHSIKDPSKN